MTARSFKIATAAAAVLYAIVVAGAPGSGAQEPEGHFGVGIPEVFLPRYLDYRARQLADAKPHVMRIRLGYVKGLSRSFTAMVGEMAVDLGTGTFSATLNGLTFGTTYSVWAVDRAETIGTSPLPDVPIRLATILATGPTAAVTGILSSILPLGFTIDRVLVTPGLLSTGEPLGAGTVNVFQKMFFRRLTLLNDSTGAVLFDETTVPPPFFALVPDLVAETEAVPLVPTLPLLDLAGGAQVESSSSGGSSRRVKLDKLISQGAELFFEETFDGNGRTCGTCHPASNNFMIDADFIATLPDNDPLFVAEFNPALAQLERPPLMRSFGLILENLDGFSAPATKFVMRGVPHTLGMQVSLERDISLPAPPAEMTGWSGDGAPGTGSLREFAIGAVTQHFTKSLQRVERRDFTLPSEHELDAMEAFQLSLGREKDFDLTRITFQETAVENGKVLFINGNGDPNAAGRCVACHVNAGALATNRQNRNFNTNVEDVLHPARGIQNFPPDGGFGRTVNPDGTIGNRTFNTASVVEAADTPPFFHNNVVSTLEGVVEFYSGPEFNGPRDAATRFNFNQTERDRLADFMRAVNTLQNIDVARRELKEILANNKGNPRRETNTRLQTAFEETQDSIDVLQQGGIFPTAVTKLIAARNLISQAQHSNDTSQRRSLVQQAIDKLASAKSSVAYS